MLMNGFYTALGTPVDDSGNVIRKSLTRQIEEQIEAGASGLLLMGSMGMEPYLRETEYGSIVKTAVEAVKGRCPLFVGAMDNSVWRVKEKLAAIGDTNIDGIVVTTPFYYATPQKDVIEYFRAVSDATKYPVYLYDLPVVTQVKITLETVVSLISDNKKIAGIKSGDMMLCRELTINSDIRKDFSVLYSGLDTFDAAYMYGIAKNLDGMFSCTPQNTSRCFKNFAKGEFGEGTKHLNNILSLRNTFIKYGVFPSFTEAMNILGYEGLFNPDYLGRVGDEARYVIRQKMQEIGEI